MIRAVIYLLLAAAVMVGVVWLAERPGEVTIVWQGWRVDMSVGILLAAVAFTAVVAALLYRFWRAILGAPRRFGRWRRDRRQRAGYAALSSGLVAVAAGDPHGARRLAHRADTLLGQPPLTLLLTAQAAQLSGDEDTAQRHFQAMMQSPETEFLGVRGLLARAIRDGDTSRALDLARRAFGLQPKAPWVLTTLFELQTRAGDWPGAAETLSRSSAVRMLPAATAQRHAAAVQLALSRRAADDGRPDDALHHAKRAYRADRDHSAVAGWLAERLVASGKRRRAARLVEEEWTRRPHPDLLTAWRGASRAATPLEWVREVERLAARAPAHPESLRARGEAALEAGLWGEARKHLTAAIAGAGDFPPASLCRKMATVEEADSGDAQAARRWLSLAAEGHPDPAWICGTCGAPHAVWQATCHRCGAFDRLEWRLPDRIQRLVSGAPNAGSLPGGSPASALLPTPPDS
jgi:HemY protein